MADLSLREIVECVALKSGNPQIIAAAKKSLDEVIRARQAEINALKRLSVLIENLQNASVSQAGTPGSRN